MDYSRTIAPNIVYSYIIWILEIYLLRLLILLLLSFSLSFLTQNYQIRK